MMLSLSYLLAATLGAATVSPCELPLTTQLPTMTPGLHMTGTTADSTLLNLFAGGRPFDQFLKEAKARREGWMNNAEHAQADLTMVNRARAVPGKWKILVVAIDACGDSMNSVPYLANLVSQVPNLELRIVLPEVGKGVQESHRTLDGRAATPTFVLLDESGKDAGCIVELPRELRNWAQAQRVAGHADSLSSGKHDFYEKDKGKSIVAEAVEMMEAAAQGKRHCDSGSAN